MLFLNEVDICLNSNTISNQGLQNSSTVQLLESHVRQDVINVERKADIMVSALHPIQEGISRIALEIPSIRNSIPTVEQRIGNLESLVSELVLNTGTKTDQLLVKTDQLLLKTERSSIVSCGLAESQSANFTDFRTITHLVRRYNPFSKDYPLKLLKKEGECKFRMALTQKPSLLRDVCQQTGDLPLGADARRWSPQSLGSCNCPKRKKTAGYWIGNTNIFMRFVDSSKHCRNCPFRFRSTKARMIGLGYFYPNRFLAHAIQATLSLTTGAGGFSISPQLSFRALVPRNSPAFSLVGFGRLGAYMHESNGTSSFSEYVENALKSLYRLFEDKKASPTDTTAEGETLLIVKSHDPS